MIKDYWNLDKQFSRNLFIKIIIFLIKLIYYFNLKLPYFLIKINLE